MLKVQEVGGYWLDAKGIDHFEETYNGYFMGYWAIKDDNGNWSETPVDIFYVKDPDKEAGHSHYFGIFFRGNVCMICSGVSAFSEPLAGMVDGDEVKISRYRHNFVPSETQEGYSIDGGRDYTKINGNPEIRTVIVEANEFIITGAG